MRTFDIFDTLIARRCIDPALVFEIVERKVGRPGFARARRQAEKVVSERDYTLDDIYAELARSGFCSQEEAKALSEAEIDTELAQVIPIRENMDQVRDGDMLITDMYLPLRVIKALLAKAGFKRKVGILLSSHGKRNGKVWRDRTLLPDTSLHMGDNWRSDIANARAAGFRAMHTTLSAPTQAERALMGHGYVQLARLVREARLTLCGTQGDAATGGQTSRDRIRLLQVQYNLPMLVIISHYIAGEVIAKGYRNVLFSSRDCLFLKDVYEALAGDTCRARSHYFYTSRVSRLNASEDYLAYFRSIACDRSLVVDLCGTGWSLQQLYRHAGFAPDTFMFHFLGNRLATRLRYRAIARSQGTLAVGSLINGLSSLWIDQSLLEMANYNGMGMTLDVRKGARAQDGSDTMYPVFEDPDFSEAAQADIEVICQSVQHFVDLLRGSDREALRAEMGAHAKQRRSILFLLYRALVREAQALTGLIAYHGEQDSRTVERLRQVGAA